MERQLALIEERGADYRLDDRTREVGRRGIAAARQALRPPTERTTKQTRKTAA